MNEEMADSMDLHDRLQRSELLKELIGAKGASKRDRRKAALIFAYYQTWGSEEWNDFNFSNAREEGFLRHLDSDQAVPHDDGCATRGGDDFPTTRRQCGQGPVKRIHFITVLTTSI